MSAIKRALDRARHFDCAVVAGACAPEWAPCLSRYFVRVAGFQPDPLRFAAMHKDTMDDRSIRISRIALADEACFGDLEHSGSPETTWVRRNDQSGSVICCKLDQFGFARLGMLGLSIAGMEPEALVGARKTLELWRPVVVLDTRHNKLRGRFKTPKPRPAWAFLEELGAELRAEFGRWELWSWH